MAYLFRPITLPVATSASILDIVGVSPVYLNHTHQKGFDGSIMKFREGSTFVIAYLDSSCEQTDTSGGYETAPWSVSHVTTICDFNPFRFGPSHKLFDHF